MAVVARLLPRHWDGCRLLQFLTGLALIALAFATPRLVPSAEPAAPPITVITTVDTPVGPGIPVAPGTAVEGMAGTETARAQAGLAQTGLAQTGSVQTGSAQTGSAQTGPAQTGPAQTGPAGTEPGAGQFTLVCVEAGAALDDVARSAPGVRGPPRI